MIGQSRDRAAHDTDGAKLLQRGIAARILAHRAHHRGVGAERRGVHGHVRRRAAEVLTVGKDVPQDLAGAYDDRP